MNLRRRRDKPIEGQSRPDGMHLERIPVQEPEPTPAEQHPEAGHWTQIGTTQGGGTVYAAPVDQDAVRRSLADAGLSTLQAALAELRGTLTVVNHQLREITADRDRLSDVSARRGEQIAQLRKQLDDALMLLRAHHADPDVLEELTPADWHDEHPVTERPARR